MTGEETRKRTSREERLAAELRSNLARRKAQARSRRQGEPDKRPDGLAAAEPPDDAAPGQRS